MKKNNFDFIVRLNKLEYAKSMSDRKVRFTGWCTIPKLSKAKIEITPFLYKETSNKFTKDTIASNLGEHLNFNIKFSQTNRNINNYDDSLNGNMLLFEGEIEAGIHDKIESEHEELILFLEARLNSHKAFSNKSKITLYNTKRPHAYFLSPNTSYLEDDFFLISLWAHRDFDEVKSVSLNIGNKNFTNLNLIQDTAHDLVPIINIKTANIYAKIISSNEIRQKKWISIKADIEFKSGLKHNISIEKFFLNSEPEKKSKEKKGKKKQAKLLNSKIDKDGRITIEANSFLGKIALNNNEINETTCSQSPSNNTCFYNVEASFKPDFGKNQIFLHEKDWVKAKPRAIQNYTNKIISIHKSKFSPLKATLSNIVDKLPKKGINKPSGKKEKLEIQNESNENDLKKDKIALISHNLSKFEGAPKVLHQIFSNLKDQFSEILVISALDGELRNEWEKVGAKVVINNGLEAKKILFEFEPDKVFANTIHSYWAVNLSNYLNIPCYWSIHESINPYKALFEIKNQNALLNAFHTNSKVCFVANSTMSLYKKILPNMNSLVIPNSVDSKKNDTSVKSTKEKLGLKENDIMFLTVGTTTKRKGQDIILEEISSIKNKNHKYFFVGAREGDYLDGLRKKIIELDLKDKVTLVEETKDIEKYYKAADVKIIASREESAPLVSLEALSYGLPIISTKVFGLAEQLEENKTCLFFNHSKKGDLAEKINKISTDKKLREKLSKNGLLVIQEKFSSNRQIQNYKKLLNN